MYNSLLFIDLKEASEDIFALILSNKSQSKRPTFNYY